VETDPKSSKETALEAEVVSLRTLLTQAASNAAHILAQAGIDATENEVAKRLQRLLLEELNHRVKNTLAIVLAITSQSLRTASTLEEGRLAITGRLIALGRAHDLLLQGDWVSAPLTHIIRSAIEPFDDREHPRFVIHGAPIEIGAAAVLPLAMSLNELCTNAIKHGALSSAAGRIEIESKADETNLKLTWTETGGPPVQEPDRRGFGTRLIRRLTEQLHGDVRLQYQAAGFVYELDVPLSALEPL
jgi:two-component sensor histidine kinase